MTDPNIAIYMEELTNLINFNTRCVCILLIIIALVIIINIRINKDEK